MFTPRKFVVFVFFAFAPSLIAQAPIPGVITNGDFSGGNTGFTSTYLYQDPTSTSPNTVFEQCTYTIAPNLNSPVPLHPSPGLPNFYDHTTGDASGMFMVINGSTTANKIFWSGSVTVEPNTTYKFSMWLTVWNDSSNNLPQIQVNFNGAASLIAIPPTPLGTWTNFTTTWFSGDNTSVTIDLKDNVLDYGGNDFALDDLSFGFVSAVPEPSTVALMSVCALGAGGYYSWKRRSKRTWAKK